MWKILNHLLQSKRQDSEQHNSALSADIFNKYFSSIGENLLSQEIFINVTKITK